MKRKDLIRDLEMKEIKEQLARHIIKMLSDQR